MRPLLATLSNLNLVNRGRGFTPSQKLIQLYKMLEGGVPISERGKQGKRGKNEASPDAYHDYHDYHPSKKASPPVKGALGGGTVAGSPALQRRLNEVETVVQQGHVQGEAIAEVVGIAPEGAEQLLETLERLSRVRRTADGKWSLGGGSQQEGGKGENGEKGNLNEDIRRLTGFLEGQPRTLPLEDIAAGLGWTEDKTRRLLAVTDRDDVTYQSRPGYWRLA